MAKNDPVGMLSSVPLFSECTKKELRQIAGAAKEVEHEAGSVVAREGDHGVGFFLILDGTAKISRDGRTVRRLGPGDSVVQQPGGPHDWQNRARSEFSSPQCAQTRIARV